MRSSNALWSSRLLAPLCLMGAIVGVSAGCSSSGADDQPVLLGPDTSSTKFDVSWKDSTVQVSEAEALTAVDLEVSDGVYHYPASATTIAGLTKGAIVLLPKIGLFTVDDIDTSTGETVLTTEPASLLDAATRGDVEFDIPLVQQQGRAGVGVLAPMSDGLVQPTGQPVSWSGTITPFNVSAKITPSGDSQTFEMSFGYDDSKSSMKMTTNGTINPFHARGKIDFNGGKFNEAWVKLDDVDGEATVDISAISMVGSEKITIPMSFGFPFAVGPIPMFASFSLGAELQATLAFKQSTIKTGRKFSFHGSTGLQYQNGSIIPLGQLDVSDGQVLDSQAQAQFSVGLGLVVDVPRIDLGVGRPSSIGLQILPSASTTPAARMSIYARLRAESVSNLSVSFAGDTKTSCLTGSTNIGAYVGGELKLFSIGLMVEKQVWGVVRKSDPSGDGCN